MKEQQKAHLALLGTNLFYGIGFTVAKFVMPSLLTPVSFFILRVGGATTLFWLSYLMGKSFTTTIKKEHWGRLILCALLGVTLNQLFFLIGLSKTSPIHASLMMLITPILVTFIAAYILKEKITLIKFIGLGLGISGAATLLLSKQAQVQTNFAIGDLFIFLNACSYAFYMVLVKPLMQTYRPIIVIRWVFLIGLIMVLPFTFTNLIQIQWQLFTPWHFAAVGFVILCTTFFTYLWNIYALNILGPSIAGAYIYAQPIFASLISIVWMKEYIDASKIIASILIGVGVYCVSASKRA